MKAVWAGQSGVRGGVFVALLLLLPALCWGQGVPAPGGVTVKDDRKDNKGTQLLATWTAPAAPAPAGLALAAYRVHLQDGKKKAKVVELLPDPKATDTTIPDLKPWRNYRVGVSALYIPAGSKPTPDEADPNMLATPGTVESATTEAAQAVSPVGGWYKPEQTNVLVTSLLFTLIVLLTIVVARRKTFYIRPIAGLRAVDDAIGRATEMGRPILYIAGLTGIGDISTIAAMLILGHLARKTAAYETPILVPCQDPLVMAIQREIVHEAYLEAGKPDAYNPDNIFYVTDSQFGYVAAVDGIMLRQKPAANFYMGYFFAESMILAETGSQSGAIQIAGTDADTQLPLFVTSCDYTLMGEELYAAGAYLSRDPVLLAQLKGQDIGKIVIFAMLVIGVILVTFTPGAGQWFMKLLEVQ
ncbi:MAG: fibronectin type III domain-containing protein [Armatimonadota bacterium]